MYRLMLSDDVVPSGGALSMCPQAKRCAEPSVHGGKARPRAPRPSCCKNSRSQKKGPPLFLLVGPFPLRGGRLEPAPHSIRGCGGEGDSLPNSPYAASSNDSLAMSTMYRLMLSDDVAPGDGAFST